MTVSLVAKLNALQFPIIHPVRDEFTVTHRETRKGKEFVVVTCPRLHGAGFVCEWLAATYGGNWLTPTIQIAGEQWKLNPRLSEYGEWQHLLFRIV